MSSCAASNMITWGSFNMLDICCGQGLASWGYWLSSRFTTIVGIDNNPDMKRHYAFDFIERDALNLDYDFLSQFDFIHASPPCQGYSKQTPKKYRDNHQKMINDIHLMLTASGKPYVIENVEGSSRELRPNIVLNGHSVGLKSDRRRYFHSSTLKKPIRDISKSTASMQVNNSSDRDSIIDALGLNIIPSVALGKITIEGMRQGIPPLMTKSISSRLFPHKFMIG